MSDGGIWKPVEANSLTPRLEAPSRSAAILRAYDTVGTLKNRRQLPGAKSLPERG